MRSMSSTNVPPLPFPSADQPTVGEVRPKTAKRFRTLDACHRPLRRVLIPRAFSSNATARSDAWPSARISATTGASSAAKASVLDRTAAGRAARQPSEVGAE